MPGGIMPGGIPPGLDQASPEGSQVQVEMTSWVQVQETGPQERADRRVGEMMENCRSWC